MLIWALGKDIDIFDAYLMILTRTHLTIAYNHVILVMAVSLLLIDSVLEHGGLMLDHLGANLGFLLTIEGNST